MDLTNHSMTSLFDQLGLSSEPSDIAEFVAQHRPLAESVKLADATFWTKGQAQFLREAFIEDADWVELIDQLNVMLRA